MTATVADQAHAGLPLGVAAARLATAARALTAAGITGPDAPRAAQMATVPPQGWTALMVDSAAETMQRHRGHLIAVGVDPDLLPKPSPPRQTPPPQAAAPAAPTTHRPPQRAPQHAPTVPAAPPPAPAGGFDASAVFDSARPAPAAQDEPVPTTPFVYDGSIEGLRGIPITDLASVGDGKVAERFIGCGLSTVYDLLMHVPNRYIDRTNRAPISAHTVGETCTVIARVVSSQSDTTRNGQRIARIVVEDHTGSITATFFNAAWQAKRYKKDDEVVVQGRLDMWVSQDGQRRVLQMSNPLMDKTGDEFAPVVPVYPQFGESTAAANGDRKWKATLTTWQIHRAAMEAVARMGDLTDPVPAPTVQRRDLLARAEAYRLVHHPRQAGDEETARTRLAYDELLRMQLALGMRRAVTGARPGIAHAPTGHLTAALLTRLPYALTGAQTRAVAQITASMTQPTPTSALLQGDVGSGKSTVAALCLLTAVESGHQAVLMAPTEILATQLHTEIAGLVDGMTGPTGEALSVGLMTNKVRSKARKETLAVLAQGSLPMIVGTHALLSDDVVFHSLGLVVVDEQHRFGVEQRAALRDKAGGVTPDMVTMTATPIPRTAAMTVFGDLDVTVLDELPPGRTPIRTEWVDEEVALSDPQDPTWALVREQFAAGRQAYVVCPLVQESETQSAANATDTAQHLSQGALSGLRVGVVHGKQKAEERAQIMASYKDGDLDVLVATTVIEVGVNVPNATVIVILDPGQFGMAQLHQLRGRVGRGQHASTCVLAGEVKSGDGRRRMDALVASTDGFVLSETDLEIRGHGQVLGASQAGLSDLRVASLARDKDLLGQARADAGDFLSGDPQLARYPGLRAEVNNALGPDGADWLTRG